MRSLLWLFAFGLIAGCTFDANVPEGLVVTCQSDADCSRGQRCQLSRSRCVSSADNVPPALAASKLVLVPTAANPLTELTALNRDAVAHITFRTTEPLGAPPVLNTSPPLRCTLVVASADSFDFACAVPSAGMPDGPVTSSADVEDVAGNQANLPLGVALEIDLTPPAAPRTEESERVVYRRVPWGSEETLGAPQFSVIGLPHAIPDGAQVVLAAVGGSERGRGRVLPNGSFTSIELDAIDVDIAELSITAVDGAGNKSVSRLVHDVEWVATLGGKVARDFASNPHVLELLQAQGRSRTRVDALEVGATDGIDRVDGAKASVEGGSSWRHHTETWPVGDDAMAAWDSDRARLVRFGGTRDGDALTGLSISNDLFEWNGTDWFELRLDARPAPRERGCLVYDPVARQMVLFGGHEFVALGDTWALGDGRWRRLAAGPPARSEAVAFYDVPHHRMLVMAGRGADGGYLDDAWELRGEEWTSLDAGAPFRRGGMAVAFDSTSLSGFAFGGEDATGAKSDLWSWTGSGFVALAVPGAQPPARSRASMTVDPRTHTLLVVGGVGASGARLDDAWTLALDHLDGGAWVAVASPALPRFADGGLPLATLFRDPQLESPQLVDTRGLHTFDSAGWTMATRRRSSAPGLGRMKLAWHPYRKAVVGFNRPGDQMHAFTNDDWDNPSLAALTTDSAEDLAWEPASDSLVFQHASETWRVTGLSMTPSAGLPGALFGDPRFTVSARASIADRGPAFFTGSDGRLRTVWSSGLTVDVLAQTLTPGTRSSEIYVHTPSGWAADTTLTPLLGTLALAMPTAVSLPDGGALIAGALFRDGGVSDAEGVTVALTAQGMTRLPNTDVGGSLSLAYDSTRGTVKAYGGFDKLINPSGEVFELGATAWNRLPMSDPEGDGEPRPRIAGSLVHDPGLGADLMFGGVTVFVPPQNRTSPLVTNFNDTWLLQQAHVRPAALFRVSLTAARLPATFSPRRATLRLRASGEGQLPVGTPQSGFNVDVWRGGAWRTVAVVLNSRGQLRSASVAIGRDDLEDLVRGPTELTFALVPRGENGTTHATLTVDYAELSLEYAR